MIPHTLRVTAMLTAIDALTGCGGDYGTGTLSGTLQQRSALTGTMNFTTARGHCRRARRAVHDL